MPRTTDLTDEAGQQLEDLMVRQLEAYRQGLTVEQETTPGLLSARLHIEDANTPMQSWTEFNHYPNEDDPAMHVPDDRVQVLRSYPPPSFIEEEQVMPSPDTPFDIHATKGIIVPSAEILTRNAEKSHLFAQVGLDLTNPFSDVYNANEIGYLQSFNFISHPHIHKYYYDAILNGVLKVRDCRTGELIRKDESVLLSNGTFIHKNDPHVLKTGTHKQKILNLLFNSDQSPKGYWVLDSGRDMYVPLSKDYVCFVVEQQKLSSFIRELFLNNAPFYNRTDNRPLPENDCAHLHQVMMLQKLPQISSLGEIRIIFRDVFAWDNSPFFRVPNLLTSPFSEMVILGLQKPSDFSLTTHRLHLDITGSTPQLSFINASLATNAAEECLMFSFLLLKYRVNGQQIASGISRPTVNNNGRLLSYSVKVEEHKKGFLTTPEEEKLFASGTKRIAKARKDHAAKIKELTEEMSKMGLSSNQYNDLQSRLSKLRNKKIFGSPEDKPIYMGFELEMQVRSPHNNDDGFNQTVKLIADTPELGDHVILKSDASTGRYGLEMVSVPATLKYHREVMANKFFDKDGLYRRFKAGNTCGIHVHISKESFTKLSLAKFITFINSSQNKYFIDSIAGRPENNYCRKMSLRKYRDGKEFIHGHNAKRLDLYHANTWASRGATNLATTSKTVEVRIFKSTTQKRNFMRKLEFCEALVRFCRITYSGNDDMDVQSFVDFVLLKQNQKDYPHLLRWLDHKKFAPREKRQGVKKLSYVYSKNNVLPTEYKLNKLKNMRKGV